MEDRTRGRNLKQLHVAIIDGYTDEPAGLGVPPYLGIYPRYVFGAVKSAGHIPHYLTVDDLRYLNHPKGKGYEYEKSVFNTTLSRTETEAILSKSSVFVVISGLYTPGKYLSARPATPSEIWSYIKDYNGEKILGGPPVLSKEKIEDYTIVFRDIALYTYDLLLNKEPDPHKTDDYSLINRFAVEGAEIVRYHPWFPFTVLDIETGRGCFRYYAGGCSFCIEPVLYGSPVFRDEIDIINEIDALYRQGARYFRLGRQSCFYSYKGDNSERRDLPRPNVQAIRNLLQGIWRRCPDIKLLHIDNVNPQVIYAYPKESEEITKLIVNYTSPGNVAAFGLESADERVIKRNNLNTNPEEVIFAAELINRYGRKRGRNGLPAFLPGINIILGLPGEDEETYEINYQFLKSLLEKNIWIRRINIRVVEVYPGTRVSKSGTLAERHHSLIMKYRNRIRDEIENIKKQADAGADLIIDCTDYCLKEGPFYSLWVYKELIFPFLKMLVDAAHKKGLYFVKHTDGNIWPIMDDLIATGIDALHSIDPSAGMKLSEVKEKYGDRIALCGNVDASSTMVYKGPKEVAEEAKQCIRDAAHGGGYFLTTSNCIYRGIPPVNSVTLSKTGKKYGRYSY
mgnify:CR=1 FL=1